MRAADVINAVQLFCAESDERVDHLFRAVGRNNVIHIPVEGKDGNAFETGCVPVIRSAADGNRCREEICMAHQKIPRCISSHGKPRGIHTIRINAVGFAELCDQIDRSGKRPRLRDFLGGILSRAPVRYTDPLLILGALRRYHDTVADDGGVAFEKLTDRILELCLVIIAALSRTVEEKKQGIFPLWFCCMCFV